MNTPDKITYGLLLFIISLVTYGLYASSKNNGTQATVKFTSAIYLIIPFLATMIFLLSRTENANGFLYRMIAILLGIITVAVILYFFLTVDILKVIGYSSKANIVLTLIFFVAFLIAMYYIGSTIKSSPYVSKSTRFYIYLFSYIPCMIVDFIDYLANQYRITTRPILILLAIEFLLIIYYVFVPMIITAVLKRNSLVLLPNYVKLNKAKEIASGDLLITDNPNEAPKSGHQFFRKNYAISMWVFLNVQPNNFGAYSNERNIFNYANGTPRITYSNSGKESNLEDDMNSTVKDALIVYFTNNPTNGGDKGVKIELTKQKWHNLVFNYNSTDADLFINGNLVKTYELTNRMPIYKPEHNIVIGDNDGLHGAICNVEYYNSPLSEIMITNTYNLYVNKNPPINNL
jgi:hypothetical protein